MVERRDIKSMIPLAKRVALSTIANKNLKLDKIIEITYRGERKSIYLRELYNFYKKENKTILWLAHHYTVSPTTIRKIFDSNFIPTKRMPELAIKMTAREVAEDIISNHERPTAQKIRDMYKISIAQAYRVLKMVEDHYAELSDVNEVELKIDQIVKEKTDGSDGSEEENVS